MDGFGFFSAKDKERKEYLKQRYEPLMSSIQQSLGFDERWYLSPRATTKALKDVAANLDSSLERVMDNICSISEVDGFLGYKEEIQGFREYLTRCMPMKKSVMFTLIRTLTAKYDKEIENQQGSVKAVALIAIGLVDKDFDTAARVLDEYAKLDKDRRSEFQSKAK